MALYYTLASESTVGVWMRARGSDEQLCPDASFCSAPYAREAETEGVVEGEGKAADGEGV